MRRLPREDRAGPRVAVAVALGSAMACCAAGCGAAPGAGPGVAAGDGAPALRPVWTEAGDGVSFGPPATAGGLAYAVGEAGTLRALELAGGAARWTAALPGETAGPPEVDSERVFVVTRTGDVAAFDRLTGASRWVRTLDRETPAGLALWGGRLFAASADGRVSALDAASGDALWTTELDGRIAFSPGAADGAVLVTFFDGRLVRLDSATGAVTWEAIPDPTYLIGTPLFSGPRVVVPGYGDSVLGLSFDDGGTVWSRAAGNYVVALPALRDGDVYFGSAQGPIYSVSSDDGAVRWIAPDVLNGRQAILLPAPTLLLVVELGGKVTLLDRGRGEQLSTIELGFDVDGAVLADEEQVVVVAGGGALHGFHLEAGAPR